MNLPNKQCSLDVLPTWLLKATVDILISPLTAIINSSLASGTFPNHLKTAIVTPIIKKPSLDSNELKCYRPVSNIKVLSKIMEKAVIPQISFHLDSHELNEPFQSGYKPSHSTETALLRARNDILNAIDKKHAVFLVLLDLSEAFDTVDYSYPLQQTH